MGRSDLFFYQPVEIGWSHPSLLLPSPLGLEDGRLQPIAYNPDDQAWNYRITDPRQFILPATFAL
jgi:hypothetical protein